MLCMVQVVYLYPPQGFVCVLCECQKRPSFDVVEPHRKDKADSGCMSYGLCWKPAAMCSRIVASTAACMQ
jgi:hypothetical protein